MKPYPSRTFIFPDAMTSQEHVQEQIFRLTSWANSQPVAYLIRRLESHELHLRQFEAHQFKGRFKTNVTVFHERAVKTLKQIINDKSKS